MEFAQMHFVILLKKGSETPGGVPGYTWKRITTSALSQPTLRHEAQELPARSLHPHEAPWSQTKDTSPKRSALIANIQYHRSDSKLCGFENSGGRQHLKAVSAGPWTAAGADTRPDRAGPAPAQSLSPGSGPTAPSAARRGHAGRASRPTCRIRAEHGQGCVH